MEATASNVEFDDDAFSMIGLGQFPPELLKEVLGKLLKEMDPETNTREALVLKKIHYGEIMAYRQVCPTWKTLIDDILAARLIGYHQGFRPNRRMEELFPVAYPRLKINNRTLLDRDLDTVYPPVLVDCNGNNPFPARGLICTQSLPLCSLDETTIVLQKLVIPYTHHLSVLSLTGTMHFEDFYRILEGAKNLKDLVVHCFNIFVEGNQIELPPLEKLHSLIVLDNNRYCDSCMYNYGSDKDASCGFVRREVNLDRWIFGSYRQQLRTMELFVSAPTPTGDLLNLKQLCIITKNLAFLYPIGAAKVLEKLSISRYEGYKNEKVEFGTPPDLLGFTDRFASSLFELYFDITWPTVDKNENPEQGAFSVGKRYPKLRKFTTNYPELDDDITLLVQIWLRKFPNLKHLILLQYRKLWYPAVNYFPHSDPICPEIPFINTLWATCRNLVKVSVKTIVYEDVEPTDKQKTFRRQSGL